MAHIKSGKIKSAKRKRVVSSNAGIAQNKQGKDTEASAILAGHQRIGRKLLSPFNQISQRADRNFLLNSWVHSGFPESLWIALLLSELGRQRVFSDEFVKIPAFLRQLRQESLGTFFDLSHSAISRMPEQIAQRVINCICEKADAQIAVSPLLLLESLPGREYWGRAISNRLSWDESFGALCKAAAVCHHHQKITSTDCRWFNVLLWINVDKMSMPQKYKDDFFRYINDPDEFGGQVRNTEMNIRIMQGRNIPWKLASSWDPSAVNNWGDIFWKECVDKFPCGIMEHETEIKIEVSTTNEIVRDVSDQLEFHCDNTRPRSYMNIRHDAVFGSTMYAMRILEELLRASNYSSILGKLGLRTILEVFISLRYLVQKNDEKLWEQWRLYGAGQAKVSALKMKSADKTPRFSNSDRMSVIANEDKAEMFTDIPFGNWAGITTRKMSEEIGNKDLYDEFYDWTSAYAHGNWAAIRDGVMQTCLNPLHRGHGIPCMNRHLGDVLPDACRLVDMILAVVGELYPEFPDRVSIDSR